MNPKYKRLKDAYAMIDGIPDTQFNLAYFVDEGGQELCGTIACAGGWCALYPPFQALGLKLDQNHKTPIFRGISGIGALNQFFRVPAHASLWSPRGRSDYDWDIESHPITDKELWKHRVRTFLAENNAL